MKLKLMDDLLQLGKDDKMVAPCELPSWQATHSNANKQTVQQLTNTNPNQAKSPFSYNADLNKKIMLHLGDITTLQVDAIVNATNETLNDTNAISQRICQKAGANLLNELNDLMECRTGDVKITSAYSLPMKYIVHTVGPKFHPKYRTAAENTLHSCYRNILQKCLEMNIRSVAIPLVHSPKKGYPTDEGAHVALRTLRRFLDLQATGFHSIILCVEDNHDYEIYKCIMPLYFPRNVWEEDIAKWELPRDIGGLLGEPINVDRQIRIIDNPQHRMKEISLTDEFETSINMGELSFCHMQGDLDQQRLLGERPPSDPLSDIMVKELQHHERYERLLRRAKTEDLSEVSGIGCLYQSGVDRLGRPVVVFVGKWFPFSKINLDKALLYLIYLLDPIVRGDYVIAYFHTLTSYANYPQFSWLREVYNILPYKYKKNLKAFYIVHPTFWTKMTTWWFTTFMAPAIKQKVHSLSGVEHLYAVMAPNQLEIPAFITEYDMTINGMHYFKPAAT